jgi:dTDP-4-dehydrorhamnose reductase
MVDPRLRTSQPERLIVTGVDGIVGANLALALADRFAVVGLHHSLAVSLEGCQTARCASNDSKTLASVVRDTKPHWIIHCGPLAQSSWDVPDQRPDHAAEARTCRLLADLATQAEGRLTVIGTDAVFTGPRMFHCEKAPTTKSHPFAQAALRVERALQKTTALIVRTHAYGWSPAGAAPGFAEQAWQALAEGAFQPLAADRHATPILVADLAALVYRAYLRGLEGICHIAGAERTSQYRFAVELAMACGLKGPVVPTEELPPTAARQTRLGETSLNTQRARYDLGAAMPLVRDGLARFAEQAKSGFRARLQTRAQPIAA